jgi:hypothetical protein
MRLAAPLVTVACLVATFWLQLDTGLNPDVAWLLTVGERMLDGQQLYVDILELNPPMSALLYLPMVALAGWLSLPAEPLVVAAILLLTLVSLWSSLHMLRRSGLLQDDQFWWPIGIAVLTVFPGGNFGEREHVAVILMLPLLAAAALRQTGQVPTLAASLLAGLGAGLAMTVKPHFALPVLIVALHGLASTRSWRSVFNLAHVTAGLVLLAYGLAVWLWFSNFFTSMLPLAAAAYVGDRRPLLVLILGLPAIPFWLMLLGVVLVYRRQAVAAFNAQLLAAAIGFFVVYLIQGKGFIYHLLPSYMLSAMVFARCFVQGRGHGRSRTLAGVLATGLLSLPSVNMLRGDELRDSAVAAIRPMGPGLAIANLSSHLEIASPLHRMVGGRLVNSGPCLWITLGAVRRALATDDVTLRAQMQDLEDYERSRLRDDLRSDPPDIILAGADGFNWLEWARQDQDLAVLLDGYEVMVTLGPEKMRLHVLQRRDP